MSPWLAVSTGAVSETVKVSVMGREAVEAAWKAEGKMCRERGEGGERVKPGGRERSRVVGEAEGEYWASVKLSCND